MRKTLILIFVITSLMLVKCVAINKVLESQVAPTADAIETITIQHPVNTASATTDVSATDLPVPTLNATEMPNIVKQLLSQNDYCYTPCIWGIFPDTTTLDDAQLIFSHLGSPLIRTSQLGDQDFYESVFGPKNGLENDLSFQIILTVEDAYVKNIRASISLANSVSIKTHDGWAAYSPKNVLKRYGPPSRIGFSISYPAESGSSTNAVWYDMTIYFDELDLIFEYSSDPLAPLLKEGETVNVCPDTDQFTGVNVWLGKEPIHPPIEGLSFEKASTHSLGEFYNTLVTNNGCFELNLEAFVK